MEHSTEKILYEPPVARPVEWTQGRTLCLSATGNEKYTEEDYSIYW